MEHNSESFIVVKEFTDKGKTTREVIAKGVTKQGFIDAYTEKGCVMREGENPHFEDIYSGIVYKLEKEFEQGGQIDRERDIEIAKTILMQLGGSNRLQMFTGAYNFVAVPYGVSFRIKNRSVNYVKIVLNGMDTYDIEFGRISGVNYKIVKELSGIYNDKLVEIFTRYTGMVLRLRKGGAIQGEENAEMVMNQNLQIRHHTEELEEILKSGKEVPAWVVSKVSRAADSMSDATHYLEGTPDKMERGGNTRIVDISKLKTYVLTYIPVFDIKRAMQIKQKAVYAESEEDAIAQLPRTAKVISIKVTSGGGRGIPKRQRGRGESQSQKIRNEIKALKETLPFLEGKDKKQIEDEIKNLNDTLEELDTLDEMRAEGQYADGGGVYDSADGISPAIQKAFNSLQNEGYFEKEAIEYVGGIKEWNKLSATEKEIIISDIEKDWSKSTFFAEGGGVNKMAMGGGVHKSANEIKKEIESLEAILEVLKGSDKESVEREIKQLKLALEAMGNDAQNQKFYIDFLNKKKGFKKDRIYFNSREEAKDWAYKNLERFDPDMIKTKMAMGGKVSKEYEAIPNTTYELKIQVYYDKGGMNYYSGGTNKRGYYLSVTPVQIQRQGNNLMIESYTAFSGIKKLILEVERQSPKSAEKAKELAESSIPELKQYVLNQMIERGEIPQDLHNPEPEPMPNEGNRIIFDLKDFDPNTTEIIDGDAYFEGFPNITDLGVLLEIRGSANFEDSQVEDLGNLQTIGGSAVFSGSKIQDLGKLQTIEGWATFTNSQVQDLGNLQTIGGGANFRDSKVQSLGNLQTIGGGAIFGGSKIQDLGNLQTIGDWADFEYSQVQDLGNLQTIGGFAYFRNSQIQSLGNLQTIGDEADFENSKVQSLGNLQTIRGDIFWGDRTDLKAEWENLQENPEPMPEEEEINAEEIRAEIVALEEVLEVLEGDDRQSIQEEIEVLKLALEGMGNNAQNADLVKFDVNKLDEFEKFQFNDLIKSLSKADALQVLINNVEGDYSQLSSDLAKIAKRQKYAEGGGVGGEKKYEIRDYNDNYVGRYNDAQLIEWAKSLAQYRKESIYINSVKDALMYIESPDRKGEQIFEVYHYGKGGGVVERNNYAEGGLVRNPNKNDFKSKFEWFLENNNNPVSKGNLIKMAYENTTGVDTAIPQNLWGDVDDTYFYVYDYQNSAFGELVDLRMKLKWSNVYVDVTIVKNGEVLYKDDLPYELANPTFHQALNYIWTNADSIEAFDIRPRAEKYAKGGGVEIPKNKSLRHYILNEMSAGMIANKVPYSDYATIDKIRIQAVQILNRDGDRKYSLQSVSDLIQEALLEYEENKSEMDFANGGGVGSIFRKAKNFGKRTLKKGVELGKSAKQKTEDAIRQKKKEIALDILYEVKENLAEGRDEMKALEKSFAVVSDRYEKGGGIGELPPKGELTNKDNFLLKYEKKGGDYEFYIYKPETKKVSGYNQIKHICVNSDCPHKMTYEQFINYLYAELYLDDMKYAKGGEIFVCPVGTQIQTLIFDKSMFNLRQAKAWAKKNNFENDFVDGKLNTLRIRQKDPAMFTEDGFRTIQLRQGVQAVIGCPKKRTIRRKK